MLFLPSQRSLATIHGYKRPCNMAAFLTCQEQGKIRDLFRLAVALVGVGSRKYLHGFFLADILAQGLLFQFCRHERVNWARANAVDVDTQLRALGDAESASTL